MASEYNWHRFDPTVDPEAKTLYQVAVKPDLDPDLRSTAARLFRTFWEPKGDGVIQTMAAEIDKIYPRPSKET